MLKLINIHKTDNIISCNVLIECNLSQKYEISVDDNTECCDIINSNIPAELKMYERQARIALCEYKNKTLPDKTTVAWC